MRMDRMGAALAAASLVVAMALAGCTTTGTTPGQGTATSTTSTAKGPIRVGSKIDTEGSLLGQMIIALLEDGGFSVEDKTRTGATDVVRKALLSGQIDIYPEYTANAILVFNKDTLVDPNVLKSAALTYEMAKSLDAPNGVIWLAASPANNTWAVALRRDFADRLKIKSMEDWAAYIKKGGAVKIVGSQEFFASPVAMPAFETAYGFKLKPGQTIALATGDTAVTEKAAAEGANGANAAMAYGTDGTLAALSLAVLSDPKGAQPIYQPAPTVGKDVFDKYPEIATILDPAFAKLSLETLQTLNGQIVVQGRDAKAVARDWLKSEGLIR